MSNNKNTRINPLGPHHHIADSERFLYYKVFRRASYYNFHTRVSVNLPNQLPVDRKM